MNLQRNLLDIICEKWLWVKCYKKFPDQLLAVELAKLKQREWLHLLRWDYESLYWVIGRRDRELLAWVTANEEFAEGYKVALEN